MSAALGCSGSFQRSVEVLAAGEQQAVEAREDLVALRFVFEEWERDRYAPCRMDGSDIGRTHDGAAVGFRAAGDTDEGAHGRRL